MSEKCSHFRRSPVIYRTYSVNVWDNTELLGHQKYCFAKLPRTYYESGKQRINNTIEHSTLATRFFCYTVHEIANHNAKLRYKLKLSHPRSHRLILARNNNSVRFLLTFHNVPLPRVTLSLHPIHGLYRCMVFYHLWSLPRALPPVHWTQTVHGYVVVYNSITFTFCV